MTKKLDEINRHIGNALRAYRSMQGMTQKDLARILGVTFQQVQKYEKGDNRLSAAQLFRLVEVLGVRIDDIYETQGVAQHVSAKNPQLLYSLILYAKCFPEPVQISLLELMKNIIAHGAKPEI